MGERRLELREIPGTGQVAVREWTPLDRQVRGGGWQRGEQASTWCVFGAARAEEIRASGISLREAIRRATPTNSIPNPSDRVAGDGR